MSPSVQHLSQCPTCSGLASSSADRSETTATCLQCGVSFFLPAHGMVPAAATTATDQAAAESSPSLRRAGGAPVNLPGGAETEFGGVAAETLSATSHSAAPTLPGAGEVACADAETPSQGNSWKAACLASAGSAALNGTIFILLGLCFFSTRTEDPRPQMAGRFAVIEDVAALETVPLLVTSGSEDPSSSPTDISVMSDSTSRITAESDSGEFALPAGVSGLAGAGGGKGRGSGTGLFSGGADARSFAYVVDASGSMNGGRMRLVLHELARSVGALKDEQQFFVVFFSDRTFPMMWPKVERKLVAANSVNRNRILHWAFTVRPDGGTDPRGALKTALDLEPDVVYLLTDGQIPESTLRVVKRSRRGTTIVNTICVGNDAETEIMHEIAQISGGEFVDVK